MTFNRTRRGTLRLRAAIVAVAAAGWVATAGGAMSSREPPVVPLSEAVGEQVVIRGTLNRYGNEPHTFLGVLVAAGHPPEVEGPPRRVIDVDREILFRLEGELEFELNEYQGRELTVRGELLHASASQGLPPVVRIASYDPDASE